MSRDERASIPERHFHALATPYQNLQRCENTHPLCNARHAHLPPITKYGEGWGQVDVRRRLLQVVQLRHSKCGLRVLAAHHTQTPVRMAATNSHIDCASQQAPLQLAAPRDACRSMPPHTTPFAQFSESMGTSACSVCTRRSPNLSLTTGRVRHNEGAMFAGKFIRDPNFIGDHHCTSLCLASSTSYTRAVQYTDTAPCSLSAPHTSYTIAPGQILRSP